MKRLFSLTVAIAFVSIMAWGCTKPTSSPAPSSNASAQADHEGHDLDTTTLAVSAYCGKCGEVKGSDACCAEGAESCDKCGLHKGSTLCCVTLDEAAVGKDLCALCGQIAGSETCCDQDAEKCPDCGLAKGSPLCCKLTVDK